MAIKVWNEKWKRRKYKEMEIKELTTEMLKN